ncbi:hypothetical protein GA0070616_1311 [Micromonospora nigra]|uniref:Uncharacterized protein n=1 Tax=Micromonospora nigra TaxID=145857 RepID=A0A1C6RKN4_9ACTN|nr:hypothetical protein [Micromonospora nigra]SCL17596.1 hypothetical protein GA0070616_1311 [Micromonospora nigra]
MRRLLAATAVTTVLFAGTACGSDDRSGAAAPTTAPATAGAPTAGTPGGPPAPGTPGGTTVPGTPGVGSGAAGGNAAEVCAAAQQAGSTAVRSYVEELGKMIAAVGANDPAAAQTARKRAESALTGWAAALRQQSNRAEDPQLRTLLTELAAEVSGLGTDLDSVDETELDRLQQRLDQLCAR